MLSVGRDSASYAQTYLRSYDNTNGGLDRGGWFGCGNARKDSVCFGLYLLFTLLSKKQRVTAAQRVDINPKELSGPVKSRNASAGFYETRRQSR